MHTVLMANVWEQFLRDVTKLKVSCDVKSVHPTKVNKLIKELPLFVAKSILAMPKITSAAYEVFVAPGSLNEIDGGGVAHVPQQYVAELAAIGQHVVKTTITYALDAIAVVSAAGADEVRKTAPPCLDFNLGATVDECDVFSIIEADMCKHSESKAAKEFKTAYKVWLTIEQTFAACMSTMPLGLEENLIWQIRGASFLGSG